MVFLKSFERKEKLRNRLILCSMSTFLKKKHTKKTWHSRVFSGPMINKLNVWQEFCSLVFPQKCDENPKTYYFELGIDLVLSI